MSAHLIVVPVVLPLVTAAVLLLVGDRHKHLRSLLNIAATVAGLGVAVAILRRADAGELGVYLASNWQAPFGIVLAADRLSALMLVLTGVVSLCAALYAEAGWSRAGVYFHPLFQIQLVGLNGAFLTGDLFDLFVFFEVTLAASYGLQLHGSGWPRVRSGLHYIAVNLIASALFLVGLAVLYGVTGTLSMADLAAKLADVPAHDRGLLHAGAAILAVAFLIKAAIWPLDAWLVPAYTAASAPVAALFAVLTKLGIYTVLRSWTLLFGESSPSAQFGGSILVYGGLATIAFAALGLLASIRLDRIAAFAIILSSGTLLAAVGAGSPALTAAALFYLPTATLAVSALFLLVELIDRIRTDGQPQLDIDAAPGEDTNLDDAQLPLVGRTVPVSTALLGLAFMVCAVLVVGLPPLSGFIAKLALLAGVVRADRVPPAGWLFVAALLGAGLAATISLARAGIRHLWPAGPRTSPRVRGVEAVAVLALLGAGVMLTIFAERVMRYTDATAAELHAPAPYRDAVLSAKARPRPEPPP